MRSVVLDAYLKYLFSSVWRKTLKSVDLHVTFDIQEDKDVSFGLYLTHSLLAVTAQGRSEANASDPKTFDRGWSHFRLWEQYFLLVL